MTAFIDDRAGSKELIRYAPLDEIGELCRLESGDVMIVGNGPDDAPTLVGVEVKSILDFISSANTGRLQGKQIPAMVEEFDVVWLAIYGDYKPNPRDGTLQIRRGSSWRNYKLGKRPVPFGFVEALLLTLTMAGVHIKWMSDPRETAVWLGCLYRWWSKPWDRHKGFHAFDKSQDRSLLPGVAPDVMARAKVAAQLPGVGFERAVAAARHFETIEEMINASREEWEEIPGIGRVIAKAVTREIRGN